MFNVTNHNRDNIERWEYLMLKDEVSELKNVIAQLQMENTLLRNDINTLKTEGCWHFVKNPEHKHE